jgi:aryl-alcohol dehydrogenase-like predicted oxidoreductase
MRTVTLGDTGLQTSAMCLGCMYFGTRVDEATSFLLLDRWFAAGGRFLDTANNYAFWVDGSRGGTSELLLGRWLHDRGVRDEIVLATKVGGRPTVAGGGFDALEGLSAPAIAAAVDESLQRLQTDYIDLLYAHWDDRGVPIEETVGAFGALVASGKVRHVGASNTRSRRLERARAAARAQGVTPYCCVQQRHSYLRPRPGAEVSPTTTVTADDDLFDLCASENVGVLGYSPLLGGAFTREDRPLPAAYRGPDSDARLAVLRAVAAERGATPNQVALAWMMGSTPAVVPLVAASSEAQLDELVAAADLTLDADARARLDAAGA